MQGIIGMVIVNLYPIVGWCVMEPSVRTLVVVLVIAMPSPIVAELGEGGD